MYMKGLGVEADLRQAYDWFCLAADNGNPAAENALTNKKFRDFKRCRR
ncbi:MAG: SEL1-like repeat protein [Muribaculaceae bacterium]|nr:SEL1-like repeat protein [Muribaculaceae bacterium]